MPKYYCDYCDTYLTHDSPSVRKTHCNGRKHKENVRLYYQKWLEEQVQKLVDDTTAAFKAGKVDNNPFQGAGGAMIPPPANMAGAPKTEPGATAPVRPPMAAPAPMGAPMPQAMPLMGHPGGGPMGPMGPMMPGMRGPLMGTPMGPPMGMPYGGRPPLLAGPPPPKMARK